ncbi:hypothetical protein C4D60_Mb03t21190 [Musa balbisiana]|uniref:Uncharacterized protein n=1 Tax=Musa balbisiana TaxID=52838 RepID=A0A4S8JBG9_MUSBA|nr:hypothetical protein C4D60_Mb03t21190 [Musa balbisiana]
MTKMSPTLLHCRRSSASISTPGTLFTLFSSDRNRRHGASDPSAASPSPSSIPSSRTFVADAASALPLLRRHSPPPPPVRHPPGRPRRPPLHLPALAGLYITAKEILEVFLIQAPAGPPTLKRGPDYPLMCISYMQMKGYETWKAGKSRKSSSAEHEAISAEPEKCMQLHILPFRVVSCRVATEQS